MARHDRTLGQAMAHHHVVHAHGIYDLEVDTSIADPQQCAMQIKQRLLDGTPPHAFIELRAMFQNDASKS